jgi:hypothetical protein
MVKVASYVTAFSPRHAPVRPRLSLVATNLALVPFKPTPLAPRQLAGANALSDAPLLVALAVVDALRRVRAGAWPRVGTDRRARNHRKCEGRS